MFSPFVPPHNRWAPGLRTAEVDGLKWQYVDFDKGLIYVRETLVNGNFETPKTSESIRDIAMSRPVFDALKAQFVLTGNRELVFCSREGLLLDRLDIDAAGRDAACEQISFNPWHTLAEHRPLGSLNRARREIYDAMAQLRASRV